MKFVRQIVPLFLLFSLLYGGAEQRLESPPGTLDGINPSLSYQTQREPDTLIYGKILRIEWLASDSSFSENPMRIGYRYAGITASEALLDSVPNSGSYDWLVPAEINGVIEIYVEAVDRFGNLTRQYSAPLTILGLNPGTRWYVASTGNDNDYNGTEHFPFATIQKALLSSRSGDSVFVAPGEYNETGLTDNGKNIYLSSRDGITQTHIHLGSPINLSGVSTLTGFWIEGVGTTDTALIIPSGMVLVMDNWFYNHPIAIVCSGDAVLMIAHNVLYNADVGILCQQQSRIVIANNDFAAGRSGIQVISPQVEAHIFNNLIFNQNGTGGLVVSAPGCSLHIRYNDLWNNTPQNYVGIDDRTGIDGNISTDPQLVDWEHNDYHLQPTSPCIDTGDPTERYDREPEPNGDRINMGVFGGTPAAAIAALRFVASPVSVVKEDSLYTQTLGIPPDAGVTFAYTVLQKPTWLELDANLGYLSGTPDNSQVGSHRVHLAVSDNFNRTDTLDFLLSVINSLPRFTTVPDSVCLEDALWQYDAQTSDEGQGNCRYRLLEPAWLVIDSTTGLISGTPTNEHVGEHYVTIQFEDGNGGVIWQRFSLTVINVNDAPVLQPLPPNFTAEDQAIVIHFNDWLAYASDVDNDITTLQWRIYSGVNVTVLSRLDSAIITPKKNWFGEEALKVVIKDAALTDTSYFTLHVLPVNDPPVWNLPDESTILSTDSLRLFLPECVTDIDDPPGRLRYAVQPDFNATDYYLQVFLTNDNYLVARPGSRTELEHGKIFISVTDTSEATTRDSLLLTVIKVNIAPQLATLPIIVGDEDAITHVDIKTWRHYVTDEDDDITQLGWQVLRSPHIDVALANDTLTLLPVDDWWGKEYLPVLVYDEKDTAFGFVEVQIQNVPDTPTLSIPANFAFREDEELVLNLDDFVFDVDTPDSLLTWIIDIENPPTGFHSELQSVTRQVRFWGDPDYYTADSVFVNYSVNDEMGLIASTINSIKILPVNDAPRLPAVLTAWPDQYEDRGFAIDIREFYPAVYDPETPADQLQWSLASGRRVFISSNVSPTEYLLASPPDWWGADTLTLRAGDGEFTTLAKLPVCLQAVNDPPEIFALPDTSFNEDDSLTLQLNDYVWDVDTPLEKLQWQVTVGDPAAPLIIDREQATATLTYRGLKDANAERVPVYYSVTDDSGACALDTNYVTIIPVNDPPFFRAALDTSYLEDEVLNIPRQVWSDRLADPDDDLASLTMTIKKDSGLVFYKFEPSSESYQFWSNQDVYGSGYFRATLTDPQGLTAVCPFTVTIIPVNDAPVISAIPDTSTNQDTPFQLALGAYTHDIDNAWAQLTWQFAARVAEVIYKPGSDSLTLIPPAGFVGYDTVFLQVSDPEGLSAADTFCLRFKDAQPPSFVIGIFQNPIASAHLDLYFFPSEKISQVRSVKIGSESKTVTLVSALNPSPFHCHHQLNATEIKEVTITATDTMENIGTTHYEFSASDVFAKLGGVVYSPDSIFALQIPPAALSQNSYILCLPNTMPVEAKVNDQLSVLAKQYLPGTDLRYTYQASAILRQPAKLQFYPSSMRVSGKNIGVVLIENGQPVYQKTYTNADASVFWIYTDRLGTFGIDFNAPEPPQVIPDQCTLAQNYPNPFNPLTTIGFALPELTADRFAHPTRLVIYDLLGREVIRLLDKPCVPGVYRIIWNGRNASGLPLASGMYFYTLEYGHYYKSRKMVLVK